MKLSKPRQSRHLCECGRVAYKKDGSGWFCRECEVVIRALDEWLDNYIKVTRLIEKTFLPGKEGRQAVKKLSMLRWEIQNRARRRAYHGQYNKKRRK